MAFDYITFICYKCLIMEKQTYTSPELEAAQSRNEIIREALNEGKLPMLPFELRELEIELLGHTATQKELGALLGEAMNTTSETWHDNAQADAVTMQSNILVQQANGVLSALRDRFIVSYDHDEKDTVSLGALVHILIGRSPETVFITGQRRSLPADIEAIVGEDVTPINVQSPIGAAIFDQSEGMVASYKVGERELSVTIVGIEYPEIPAEEE